MRYFLLLPLRARMRGGRRAAVFAARNDDDNNLHTKSHCAQNYYLISNQSNILSFLLHVNYRLQITYYSN